MIFWHPVFVHSRDVAKVCALMMYGFLVSPYTESSLCMNEFRCDVVQLAASLHCRAGCRGQ